MAVELTPVRIVFLSIFILLLVGASLVVIFNYNKLFEHKIRIDYPDGCTERYINGKNVTPECTEGRRLLEDQTKVREFGWNLNYTIGNQS